MATASAQSTRTRRTASREADALAGERAHMLIWRSGMKQLDVAAAIGIEPTAFGKKLRGKNGFLHHGGEIPEGWDVDHLCKRRNCVNPGHLEAVPEIVNIRRAKRRHVTIDGQSIRICREGHLVRGQNMAKASQGKYVCWLCSHPEPASRPPYKRRLAAIADAS